MVAIDCPFRTANGYCKNKQETKVIIVDMHAEVTAEKIACKFSDGKVAVIGTHTHVQTSDERIFPNEPVL